MKIKIRYLIIIIVILFTIVLGVSFSYFKANVIVEEANETKFGTGNINLIVKDYNIETNNIIPIYDYNYESGYVKEFSIESNSSLNSCAKLYLSIKSISDSLKSDSFKYKLVLEDGTVYNGDFTNANSNEDLLILDNIFIEKSTSIKYKLYLWISYLDEVDQMDMLGTELKASILVKGIDAKDNYFCK